MLSAVATAEIAITPTPIAHFGAGAVGKLPAIVRGTGSEAAVVVTDAGLAATPVVAAVTDLLSAAGIMVSVFSGVHPNPTTGDLAAGADAVAEIQATAGSAALVAVGGGSAIDAAKGLALAPGNPPRGRGPDYRRALARPARPARTGRRGRRCWWPRPWPGSGWRRPASASAMPSATRSADGSTSRTAWRSPWCCHQCSASTSRAARSAWPTSPLPSAPATAGGPAGPQPP